MFKIVLKLQLVWVILGLAYNALSFLRVTKVDQPLSPTDPIIGLTFMSTAAAIISLGLQRKKTLYISFVSILILMLAYSGVYLHIKAFSEDPTLKAYASHTSWASAVIINLYGLLLLLAGLAFASKQD